MTMNVKYETYPIKVWRVPVGVGVELRDKPSGRLLGRARRITQSQAVAWAYTRASRLAYDRPVGRGRAAATLVDMGLAALTASWLIPLLSPAAFEDVWVRATADIAWMMIAFGALLAGTEHISRVGHPQVSRETTR